MIKRFINADGYINANGDILGFNMYAYCGNNPVMSVDYSGESITLAIAGVAISAKTIIAVGEIIAIGVISIGLVAAIQNSSTTHPYYINFKFFDFGYIALKYEFHNFISIDIYAETFAQEYGFI